MGKKLLTLEEATALSHAACRNNLSDFICAAFSIVTPGVQYKPNWHIDCIAEHLHAVHRGEIRRLIINIPPRTLKSTCVSIAYPAWLLGVDPTVRTIVGSYAQSLSERLSTDTRLIMEHPWYQQVFPETKIAEDQNQKRKFQTTKRGHRIATSVGSGITGEGGDYLLMDDPHNPLQTESDIQRQEALDWFGQTFSSRQNDPRTARFILVMQRLHVNDLTGYLLEQGGWHHLCLPAIAPRNILISLKDISWEMSEGEYLHSERLGPEELDRFRIDMGDYGFAGQMMQTPVPDGGGLFKDLWMQYYTKAPDAHMLNIYIFVDAAYEKKKTSDYTAMVVVGLGSDHNYYLLDIVRDRFNPTERIEALIKLHKKWNKLSGKPPIVGYEKNGASSDLHYLNIAQERLGYRFAIIPLGTYAHKNDRIKQLIPLFQTRRFYFPISLPYIDHTKKSVDLIRLLVDKEMLLFPVGLHPDMLDALSRVCDPDIDVFFPAGPKVHDIHIDLDIPYVEREQSHNNIPRWVEW